MIVILSITVVVTLGGHACSIIDSDRKCQKVYIYHYNNRFKDSRPL